MRIALLSDTHGNYPLALHVLDQIGPVDLIIHLGDGCEDMEIIGAALNLQTYAVAGNCDRSPRTPRELLLSLAGKFVLVTHGDRYLVKSGLDQLQAHARSLHADVVFYGHTHIARETVAHGLTLINPGALTKIEMNPSIAIVTISDDDISTEIVPVQQPQPQL